MKTDYITASSTLPPYLAYPRFLLGMDLRLITKDLLRKVKSKNEKIFTVKKGALT